MKKVLVGDKMFYLMFYSKKFLIFIINILLYIISIFIPKKNDLIIIGGWFGKRFADNSKYLYLYNYNMEKPLNMVWITGKKEIYTFLKKRNLPVAYKKSFKAIWIHFRAKYHIVDQSHRDIIGFLSVRSKRINLWHGVSPKNGISRDMKDTFYAKIEKALNGYFSVGGWGNFQMLSPSQFSNGILSTLSNGRIINFINYEYPRAIYLKNKEKYNYINYLEDEYCKMLDNLKKSYKLVFYIPTFRDKQNSSIFGENNEEKLNEFFNDMKKQKVYFVLKMHFANTNLANFQSSNCLVLPSDIDIYPLLKYSDALITDYSSIYTDYLLLNRPVLFNPYDYESFDSNDRGFILDYNEYTPGNKYYSLDSLKEGILQLKANNWNDNMEKERMKILNIFYDQKYDNVIKYFEKQVKK